MIIRSWPWGRRQVRGNAWHIKSDITQVAKLLRAVVADSNQASSVRMVRWSKKEGKKREWKRESWREREGQGWARRWKGEKKEKKRWKSEKAKGERQNSTIPFLQDLHASFTTFERLPFIAALFVIKENLFQVSMLHNMYKMRITSGFRDNKFLSSRATNNHLNLNLPFDIANFFKWMYLHKCRIQNYSAFQILSGICNNSSRKLSMFARDAPKCTIVYSIPIYIYGRSAEQVCFTCASMQKSKYWGVWGLVLRTAWGRHQVEAPLVTLAICRRTCELSHYHGPPGQVSFSFGAPRYQFFKGSCTYYLITFRGPERPPPSPPM